MRIQVLLSAAVLAVVAALVAGISATGPSPRPGPAPAGPSSRPARNAVRSAPRTPTGTSEPHPVSLGRMVGQLIVGRFGGPRPPAGFLARVRRGQMGGVILFSDNLPNRRQAGHVIARLQHAARAGGNPPLLVMTDQEGGEVKRLSWAPPALAPSAMRSAAVAQREGHATAVALRAVGIDVDLAPVADVKRVAGSFLGSRSFGSDASTVASRACAFAQGVASAGVAFTLKHFPGLGRALESTDVQPTAVDAPAGAIRADYSAYRRCGGAPLAFTMIASAAYPSLTGGAQPAVLSPEIYREELRAAGEPGAVTISDNLQAPALTSQPNLARRAVAAGLDLLLYAGGEAAPADAYRSLLAAARAGALQRARVENAYRAVQTLKGRVGIP